jgi:ARG and Rhodanese-Phosphatase-superfamily-associated Protein domain
MLWNPASTASLNGPGLAVPQPSVHQSLESCGAPKSDQGEVWNGVAELQVKACCMSPTSAMSDVYKARDEDLRKCDEILKPLANQIGLLAFIGGKPAGEDLVSLTSAYAKLHPKLVRSYTLEGLLDAKAKPANHAKGSG